MLKPFLGAFLLDGRMILARRAGICTAGRLGENIYGYYACVAMCAL